MKRLLISLALLISTSLVMPVSAQEAQKIDLLPAITSESSCPNRVWVGTFQIVWNELMDEIVHKPIKFAGFDSPNAKLLNQKTFTKANVSEKSYYVKSGEVSPELKEEIETAIKEKFKETSDILDGFDWTYDPQKLFVYAMLKKDFKFLVPFDRLAPETFGKTSSPVNYFGIKKNGGRRMYKNVKVMFYNDYNDFAVKLYTKSRDMMILYRTDEDMTFDKYFEQYGEKSLAYRGNRNFTRGDVLRIPDIDLYLNRNFPELEGHRIKGTNLQIDKTIETVDFKMNKDGVKLKSEAAILAKMTALLPERGRFFNYTDTYVLFLIEKSKKTPYFAMRVNDVETFNNTKK